ARSVLSRHSADRTDAGVHAGGHRIVRSGRPGDLAQDRTLRLQCVGAPAGAGQMGEGTTPGRHTLAAMAAAPGRLVERNPNVCTPSWIEASAILHLVRAAGAAAGRQFLSCL